MPGIHLPRRAEGTCTDDDEVVHTDLDGCQAGVQDLKAALRPAPSSSRPRQFIGERGCTPDEAFSMLTTASQRENRRLRDIAAAIGA